MESVCQRNHSGIRAKRLNLLDVGAEIRRPDDVFNEIVTHNQK